ncbi:hypothetical protein J4E81_000336 [Alternaria sp. BMP 2799]|nr:hypothetical protein J4E81_000336 [Alternaria sp. BMP 2799]
MLRPRTLVFGTLVFATLVVFWTALHLNSLDTIRQAAVQDPLTANIQESRLHLLIVATSSGLDLCRLLLSASVLLYPPPVLIDWAGAGAFNAAETHLAKIAGPLRYLESLSPAQDTDIVLLVDGFDVTFQLGPDVLLKRYFEETAAANNRLVNRYGKSHMRKHKIYNSILFGPDKVCWPEDVLRLACWVVPDSPLHPDAFGPYTDGWGDMNHARPRWLNSGTIIGPAGEMREMFRATQEKIKQTYNPEDVLRNSDQKYFADVWGDQEYARILSHGDKPYGMPEGVQEIDLPTLKEGEVTEYHIGLDYRSSLFQTAAGYRNYIAWMATNRSSLPSSSKSVEPYRIDLQEDVLQSRKPFAAISDDPALKETSWRDVSLGFNTVTGQPFPVLHFTGDKSFRDTWWPRMWYSGEAERLQRTASQVNDEKIGSDPINGVRWTKNMPYDSKVGEPEEKSGAWSDQGASLSWKSLCESHEPAFDRHLVPTAFSSSSKNKAKHSSILHVLIPADHKDVNLCKTMLSAAVAGYPTPTLINWGATFDDKSLVAGGSHIAKISGVLEYLRKLGPERDDDLLLLVDGYDIWFQLRPSALISRFHAINNAANARIRKTMGSRAAAAEGISQDIVFSAQKRCWPWKPEDPPCYAVPQSSLPEDVYGPQTDTDIGWDKNPYVKFRQRYLNSGDAMGRVGAMKALFERAMEKADKDRNFGSDQKIFSEIFGDQEFQREVMRQRHRGFFQKTGDWLTGRKSILSPQSERHLREHRAGKPDEFGIGLDYASLLGHPTVFAEEDSAWVTHGDPKSIAQASAELNVAPVRVHDLVQDITESQPPFRPAVVAPGAKFPDEKSWNDVPLYTNMWTSVVPGLIHHNAHRDGLKSLRVSVWDRMWYFNHTRKLYESNAMGPVAPVAVVHDDAGVEQAWWSPIAEKGGAKSDKDEWLPFNDLCKDFEKEVFRDV